MSACTAHIRSAVGHRIVFTMLIALGCTSNVFAQLTPEPCVVGTWEETDGSLKIEFEKAEADAVTGTAEIAGGPTGKMESGSFDGEKLSTTILLFDFPDVSEPAILARIEGKIPKNLEVSLTDSSTLEGTITLSDFDATEEEGIWNVEILPHVVTVPIVLQRVKPLVDSIVFLNLEGETIVDVGFDEAFTLQLTLSKTPSECIDREIVQLAVASDGEEDKPIEIEVIETDARSGVFKSEIITLKKPEEDT